MAALMSSRMALGEVVGSYLRTPTTAHHTSLPCDCARAQLMMRARFMADSISGRMALGDVVGSYLLSCAVPQKALSSSEARMLACATRDGA
jgi:hypothetical protein